jgi:hypothetical protein
MFYHGQHCSLFFRFAINLRGKNRLSSWSGFTLQVLLWTTLFTLFFCWRKTILFFYFYFLKLILILILILFIFIFIFRLISLLSFMLFRKPIWNDNYFLIIHLIFDEIFMINLYFFNLLYRWTLFLKIKRNLFSNNIYNMYNFTCFFSFILFNQFNMCVYFYYRLIG